MWDPDGTGPLPAQLVVAGRFGVAGAIATPNIALLDQISQTWSPLGAGLTSPFASSYVQALLILPNNDLVAAGEFLLGDGQPARRVARWNGTTWLPFGPGFNGAVTTLSIGATGDLYAGGEFTASGTTATVFVARWNGTAWQPLGSGTNGPIYATTVMSNGDVVVGGAFTTAGGTGANNVARWNGVSWSPLGQGVDDTVRCLLDGGAAGLRVGGAFTTAGGASARRIASWNGTTWSPLGSGVNNGVNSTVHAMQALPNGDLVVVGQFTTAGGNSAWRAARWDGSAWSAFVPANTSDLTGTALTTARFPNGDIVVGLVNGICHWNGTNWLSTGTGLRLAWALASTSDGRIVVGAQFTALGNQSPARVFVESGSTWQSLGSGMDARVMALARMPNGDFVAGGDFNFADGVQVNKIARWNGTQWTYLSSGTNQTVQALLVMPNGDLIVGGFFSTAGGVPAAAIAKWNGSAWSALGSGMNTSVEALAVMPDGSLIAGGQFTTAGGVAAAGIARWNGSAWSSIGSMSVSGSGGRTLALTVTPNGDLVAGGVFATVGGVNASNVARWNGTSWAPMTSGMNSDVYALAALPNGDVIAGGPFTIAGGVPANYIARWNGTAWSPIGSGMNDRVRAIQALPSGELAVSGDFYRANGGVTGRVATLSTTCPAQSAPYAGGCASSGGNNLLTAVTLPWAGSTWRTRATGLPTTSLVVVVTGLTAFTPGLDLSSVFPVGVAGCELHVAPDILAATATTNGTVDSQLPLTAPSLVGLSFHHQMIPFGIDAVGAITSTTATNTLSLTVGSL